MSDLSVSERRIRPIQDAVASGNWKQALKECDKWQKKGEKSDKFLALKAFILVNQTDHGQTERGQAEILQLCHRTPAVTDIEAIHFLQDALKDLSIEDEEAPKLWDRAAAARPTDQGLLMTWLNGSIADSNWLSAQKAAMALRKAFPKDRQYEFWNILMYFLVHKDTTLPEKNRDLFGNLAYRLITKAAESIPTDPEQLLTPGKAISTPEELYLLVNIYLGTGHASEAVDLLRGPLNTESRVGQQDPQLVNTLLLQALEESKRWSDAFQVCKKLIEKPEYRGDDRVWDLLFKAGSGAAVKDEYKPVVDDYTMKMQLRDRPAQLTRLKDLRAPAEGDSVPHADILIASTQYYHLYKDKSFCFEDLKDSLKSLDESHKKDFSTFLDQEISQKPTTQNKLFRLKYERLLAPTDEDESSTIERASKAIDLYNSSRTDNTPCPEASLIAALDLLLAATLDSPPNTSYILRAILILSVSCTHYEDYFPYSILLMYCYINLGLMSLAMETFVKLSVKNLQWENVAHIMLSRISSLHPFQHGKGENSLNPSGALEAGLTMLERSTDALNRGIRDGLKHGSYANIIDSVNLRRDFQSSINKQIYFLEERKIARLMDEVDPDDDGLVVRAQETVDKRDFSFLPKYTTAEDRIYDTLKTGPLPGDAWVDCMAMVQYLLTYLKTDPSQPDRINEFVDLAGPPDRIKKGLTENEWRLYGTAMLVQALAKGGIKGDDARQMVQTITQNLETAMDHNERRTLSNQEDGVEGCIRVIGKEGLRVSGWEYIHACYLQFEVGAVVDAYVHWWTRQNQGKGKGGKNRKPVTSVAATEGVKAEDIASLRKVLGELQTSIKASAKSLKKSMGEGGLLGQLVDIALARNEDGDGWKRWREVIEGFVGAEGEIVVEGVVAGWMGAWEEGLEGVGGVRIRLGV